MKKNLCSLIFLLTSILANAQNFTAMDSLRGGWHEFRSCFDLQHYHLKLKVDPKTRFISGSNRWTCRGISASQIIQVDLDAELNITSIISSSGPATYKRKGSSVLVDLPFKIQKDSDFWIEIQYNGHPRLALNPPWDGGFVWSRDQNDKPWIGVACEGDGASLWFPSKDHPADEPDSALLEYEVPDNLIAVGNGRFLGKKKAGDSSSVYKYGVSYPINHYNITFNAADYQSWSDTMRLPESRSILPMTFYALRQDFQKAKIQWAQSKKIIRVLSESFGDYPFVKDGYKVVQTPYLGMEHQSCIAYGDQFQNNFYGFDFILLHETAHEWWGNRTSADDHADLWIHEALATYSEAVYLEKLGGGKKEAIRYLLDQRKKIKNRTAIAGQRGVYFNEWKDSDMYYKGSWMLHSMRYAVGNDKIWFKALHDIGNEIGFKPISADTFSAKLSKLLKVNIQPLVNHYTQFLTWPALEYHNYLEKGKEMFSFKWVSSAEGFDYSAPVVMDGRTERINPSSTGMKFELKLPVMKIEPSEELYLFKMQYKKR